MKPIINEFYSSDNSGVSSVRTTVLFGRNVSTYKLALASILLNLKPLNQIAYEDLKDYFIRVFCDFLIPYPSVPNFR
jgi:hypothetical protein